jgi:hypothetical protein
MKVVFSEQFEQDLRYHFGKGKDLVEEIGFFFRRIKSSLFGFKRSIKFAYQRVRYGVDESMTWSLDSYLREHILKLLKQFLEQADGFVDLTYHKHPDGRTQKQWIEDMIKTFEQYEKLEDEDWMHMEKKAEFKKIKKEMKDLFGELFESLWW